jgi:hypothetical protein
MSSLKLLALPYIRNSRILTPAIRRPQMPNPCHLAPSGSSQIPFIYQKLVLTSAAESGCRISSSSAGRASASTVEIVTGGDGGNVSTPVRGVESW